MRMNTLKNKIIFGVIVALVFFLSMGTTYAFFCLVVKGNNTINVTNVIP